MPAPRSTPFDSLADPDERADAGARSIRKPRWCGVLPYRPVSTAKTRGFPAPGPANPYPR
ncbi:hypothetical protein LX36DRAFT_662055 [Colletotrichum falcatum]|nr:hypothetical protein LX36DRAFT_662055 [Colletotrichum falcatum]